MYRSYAELQTRFRTFWRLFHVWFGYRRYYISNTTVEADLDNKRVYFSSVTSVVASLKTLRSLRGAFPI